jgi:hypothetical protein
VEYLRKEERKDCLGKRAEMRGTRRAEVRKERVTGFMAMVVVAGKRGGDEKSGNSELNGGVILYIGSTPICQVAKHRGLPLHTPRHLLL